MQLQKVEQNPKATRSDTVDEAPHKVHRPDDTGTQEGDQHPLPEVVCHRPLQECMDPLRSLCRIHLVVHYRFVDVVYSVQLAKVQSDAGFDQMRLGGTRVDVAEGSMMIEGK